MSALLASKSARRQGAVYVGLLVASLLLLSVSSNPFVRDLQHGVAFAFKPFQVAVDGVASNVTSIFSTIVEIDGLRQENETLRADNDRLAAQARAAEELRRENEQLTALLQLRNGLDYHTTAASVIARESTDIRRTVVIDRGSDEGLKVGDIVITAGGALAGRIVDVGTSFAYIGLISDASSTVIGQLSVAGVIGKVSGTGQERGELIMADVDATATVTVGEEVYTAGLELGAGIRSPYPKGLLIGRVVQAVHDPNEVVQTVILEPAAPLDRLEYLLVITDYQGGITGPIETGVPCKPTEGGTLPDSDQPCASDAPRSSSKP
ncbi:MAG TPA: rod shape-determining protein MreC [Candidatus Limnocylindrales bacterium]|nr:rod shape-determining protein MreC [Candidatus Limnocylindrales bacterium]